MQKAKKSIIKHKKETNKDIRSLAIFGELFGLALALIFLYMVFPRLSFITDDYYQWQPIGATAAIVSAFLNIMKRLVNAHSHSKLFEALSVLITLYSTYVLFTIFPIDLSIIGYEGFESVAKLAMQALMVALGIAVMANLVAAISSKKN